MLGQIFWLKLVVIANLSSRIVLNHHRGGDGHEERRSGGGRCWRGAGRNWLEIAENFDGGWLLEFAAFDGILGKSEGEDHVVALLRGREVVDRGGNRRFAFGGLAGSTAAGEKGRTDENGNEKMENGWRHS